MPVLTPVSTQLHCYTCELAAQAEDARRCETCGAPLSLRSLAEPDTGLFAEAPGNQWHYRALLPDIPARAIVSLGEGATPLISAVTNLGLPGLNIRIKNEAGNPTGSFKDRQVSVGISHARALGKDTVAVVSSGNVACAAAAYAARAGMRAIVLTHAHAAPQKLQQAAAYGATVLRVHSPSASSVFQLCIDECERRGWYHLSTAGIYDPYTVEGAKTIAYELYTQTQGKLPDWIVLPVGGGGLLGGVWRGFLDLQRLRLIDRVPRLAGVQPTGCAPIVRAIDNGYSVCETLQHRWENPETVAGGLADDILFDAHTALPAIRATEGAAVAVDDDAILDAMAKLARTEGLLCEPSSAVVFAALQSLPLEPGASDVCCLLTGSGIKDLGVLQSRTAEIIDVDAEPHAIARVLGDSQ